MVEICVKTALNDLDYLYDIHKEYEITFINYEQTSIMSIYKTLSTISLLGANKLIIVDESMFLVNKTNKLKKKEEEIFIDLVNAKTNNKVIFLIPKEINKTISYVKDNISKLEYVDSLENKKDQNFIEKYNIQIDKKDLKFLKENIAEDLDYQSELLKLSLYKEDKVNIEDIKEKIKLKNNINIFKFIESLVIDNKERAKQNYETILYEEDFSPEQILAIMHSQLKFFIQLNILKDRAYSLGEMKSTLKTSDYRIKIASQTLRKTTLDSLIDLQSEVAKYDYLIKSGKTQEKDVIINFLI